MFEFVQIKKKAKVNERQLLKKSFFPYVYYYTFTGMEYFMTWMLTNLYLIQWKLKGLISSWTPCTKKSTEII